MRNRQRDESQEEFFGLRTPLVSVVIPAYNHEHLISATLESVFSQTLADFELIVVDDGSQDQTAAVVASFKDDRLKLVRQENRGTAAAVNRGLELSRGSYIAILNSDDIFLPKRLALLLSLLREKPEAMLAFSRVSLIDAEGNPFAAGEPETLWLKEAEADYHKSGDLLLSLLRDNFLCTSSNFFFRRCLLAEIGYFRDLRYVNDLDFLLRALCRHPGVFYQEELLAYRQHGTNTLKERTIDKEADFLLEVAWVLAAAFADGGLVRQWDFQTLCELLAQYYRLNLEVLLFSILYFRAQDRGFCAPAELERGSLEVLLKSSRSQLEERSYRESLLEAKTFHFKQSQLWQEQSESWQAKNQTLLVKMRERDLGLARATELQHEIWQSREWYRQLYEMVINSRRFRLFTILGRLRRGEEKKANLRELLRLLLPDSWRTRLRSWRNLLQELRQPAWLKTVVYERIRGSFCRLFASHRYEQETWSVADAPLLSLIVVCESGPGALASFCDQLKRQSWTEFTVYFLVAADAESSIEYLSVESLRMRERQDKRAHWHIVPSTEGGLGFGFDFGAESFNRALELASGKYIVSLKSSDELVSTFLEEALLKIEAAPPHFFLQALRDWSQVGGNGAVSAFKLHEGSLENCFRPLVFRRSAGIKIGGYSTVVARAGLEWEFYINLWRHGYQGSSVSERIFKSGRVAVQPAVELEADSLAALGQIRTLHLGAILNRKVELERRVRQFWQVSGALCNFSDLPIEKRESALWLDLFAVDFVPWQLLPLLKEWSTVTQEMLVVTVPSRFNHFFLYNKTAGVRVYFPKEYHLQGKRDYCDTYLAQRYNLEKVLPADILAKCLLQSVGNRGKDSDRAKLRILYASPWLITGGADTMTVDWFRELDGQWCEKYLVTTLHNNNNWLPKIADYAAGIFDLPRLGCLSPAAMTDFMLDFIGRYEIDILHIMNSEVAFDALPKLKARFPELKVVAQFHCFDYLSDGKKVGYPHDMPPRYDHLIDSYNIEYFQLGEDIQEFYPYITPDKFKVIHGSVDATCFNPEMLRSGTNIPGKRHEKALNLLFIGRLDRQKQPLRLLDIAVALRCDGVNFVLHVIGDGSLESQKREFLSRLESGGLKDKVLWYGEQSLESMREWYQIADILLLTSDWEGVPMVLFQAMAMAVVPVVADVGGCAELVTPDCGYLVAEKENTQAYVSAIKELLDDQRRHEMGALARQRMLEHFSLAGLDPEYRTFYGSL